MDEEIIGVCIESKPKQSLLSLTFDSGWRRRKALTLCKEIIFFRT